MAEASQERQLNKSTDKPIKCNRTGCTKSFRKPYDLKRHLLAHDRGTVQKTPEELDQKKIFECDVSGCEQAFTRKFKLKCHQYKKHGKEIASQNEEDKQKKKFHCDESGCGQAFLRPERLKAHKLNCHCEERPFKCDFEGCGKSYSNDSHLKRHKKQTHSSELHNSEEVICHNCSEIFVNKYTLMSHIESAHRTTPLPNIDRSCDKKKSDITKLHICDVPGCNASFRRPYRLKNHKLAIHDGQKPFKCFYTGCERSYTNESHLTRHVNVSHSYSSDMNKMVICGMDDCGMLFANKYVLKKHIARNHRTFPFQCSDCDQKFKRKTQLQAHRVEAHAAEAPYKCQVCPKVFIQYHYYKKHLDNHKSYQCDCEANFDKWSKLLEHRKTECTANHKKYTCVICDKVFPVKKALTDHVVNVHIPDSQIDLVSCPYLGCTRAYKYKKNLNQHINSFHLKLGNSVKCPRNACELVFKSNKNLKQHIRTVHSGLPLKIRKPRKPRKDRGKDKKSMASKLSGVEVSSEENQRNIIAITDRLCGSKELKIVISHSDRVACCNKDGMTDSKAKCNQNNKDQEFLSKSIPKDIEFLKISNCVIDTNSPGYEGLDKNVENPINDLSDLGSLECVDDKNESNCTKTNNEILDSIPDILVSGCNQNSCDSGVHIFDFPELENISEYVEKTLPNSSDDVNIPTLDFSSVEKPQ